MSPAPPLTEQGAVDPDIASTTAPSWGRWTQTDADEHVPDLQWPQSIETYRRMGKDGQVKAVTGAIEAPVRRFGWHIDPNGAPDATVRRIAEDLGLPVAGERDRPRPRGQKATLWSSHLRDAMRALRYGHYAFNLVVPVVNGQNRLAALSPRPPATIDKWDVARDGSLIGVTQTVDGKPVQIKADHLAVYSWEREGANWIGESLLRPLYRSWKAKDVLLRVDLLKHERNGMGVPTPHATDPSVTDAQLKQAEAVARAWRAGEESSAAMPFGITMKLLGVEGTLPDTIASARYHDEEMARALGQMILQLGQTETGSRSLGDTFADFALNAVEGVAGFIADTGTQQIVERLVDLNEGPDAPAPRIGWEHIEDPELSVADLALLVEKGVLTVDEDLEDSQRTKYRLPARSATRLAPIAAAAEMPRPNLRSGPARRMLTEVEVRAAADFEAIDGDHQDALDQLIADVRDARGEQVDALVSQVEAFAGDPEALAQLAAVPIAAAAIRAALRRAAARGVEQVVGEFAAQGEDVEAKVPAADLAALDARAAATAEVLGQGVAQTARAEAVRVTAEALQPTEVAALVRDRLDSLTDAALRPGLAGALTTAQNAGRKAAIAGAPPARIYASALLDSNACGPCVAEDGTEYETLADAEKVFPSGGNIECEGGGNCRCTLVAVADTEAVPTSNVRR